MKRPVRTNHRMIDSSVEAVATDRLRTLSEELPWYCSHVLSGRERQYERILHRFGIPTYCPMTSKQVRHEDRDDCGRLLREREVKRAFPVFPGYVFVALDDYGWVRTRSIEVARRPRWLDFGSGPVLIPSDLITDLREREKNGFIELLPEREEYQEGDELEITDGSFRGMRGILASDPNRRLVTLHMLVEGYSLQSNLLQKTVIIPRDGTRKVIEQSQSAR